MYFNGFSVPPIESDLLGVVRVYNTQCYFSQFFSQFILLQSNDTTLTVKRIRRIRENHGRIPFIIEGQARFPHRWREHQSFSENGTGWVRGNLRVYGALGGISII